MREFIRLLDTRGGPPPPPPESGVRHAGCDHLARPGERCAYCGLTLPVPAAPPSPRRRRRRAA